MSKYTKYKPRSLVGRYIYFRMTKKQLAASTIVDLTPYKNYKVLAASSNTLVEIKDDSGYGLQVRMPHCAYLCHITGWHVRHPNAGELSNG